jgi:hypothetical protein
MRYGCTETNRNSEQLCGRSKIRRIVICGRREWYGPHCSRGAFEESEGSLETEDPQRAKFVRSTCTQQRSIVASGSAVHAMSTVIPALVPPDMKTMFSIRRFSCQHGNSGLRGDADFVVPLKPEYLRLPGIMLD